MELVVVAANACHDAQASRGVHERADVHFPLFSSGDQGDFVENKFHGEGKYVWNHGAYYMGNWSPFVVYDYYPVEGYTIFVIALPYFCPFCGSSGSWSDPVGARRRRAKALRRRVPR